MIEKTYQQGYERGYEDGAQAGHPLFSFGVGAACGLIFASASFFFFFH